jgi:OmpA-OmpF porin, OOP family
MPNFRVLRALLSMAIPIFLLSVLVGCAGLEVLPDGRWVPKELPAAGRAVDAAKQAGKDKECPDEFKAAEKLKNDAWPVYQSCRTKEAIAMANEAASKAAALCPKKAAPPPAPTAPPAAPAPTVSLSASPGSVPEGKCATLTWSSSNASSASIDQGVGRVDPSGSRQVCPDRTTQYTIAAVGEGGSRSASTTVTVNPKVVDRLTLHVNFDFNKATVRKQDDADLQKAIDFVKKYPGYKISLEGYTDNIGSDKYNLSLSEKRADAVKAYLLKHGVTDGARIKTSGHGKSNPIADNSTEKGRFENRRVEILILSD